MTAMKLRKKLPLSSIQQIQTVLLTPLKTLSQLASLKTVKTALRVTRVRLALPAQQVLKVPRAKMVNLSFQL
ncbi:hypothetical protein ACX4Y9_05840 [Aerococcus loyolae]